MGVNLIEKLKGDLTEYRSIPFWSWNDELKGDHLRSQIRDMKQAGMGGFFMHARGGLQTEYLGEDWFHCVGECIDEARKQKMRAWAYDENGWPSGFAGMKLLEDPANYAHYLVSENKDAFDPEAAACYRVINDELVRITDDDGAPVLAVYDRTNSSVVDILNWKIVRAFIEETHEKYFKRFAKDFGEVLMGFFTDEPQYFRYQTAYSPVMKRKYNLKYGTDILDELGFLFVSCRGSMRFRYRYWKLMNELYTESFAGQIYRWCTEHNCMLTGHSIEESSLFGQMMCCAGIMPFYEYEHIPGMDWLGRNIRDESAPRQVSSVAMQLGKKQVLTESFACCGWSVTPKELKRVLEWQYVNGVNLLCQHLYPYSIRGQRKRDYPAFFSNHNPWAKEELRAFNDYFTRLGYMLSESREIADTVIIHPVHSAYLTFDRHDSSTINEVSSAWVELIETLGAAGILHHYADETLLAKYGMVKGKKLCIGKCSYSQVVVPEMENIDDTTLRLLTEFVKCGGKLCFAGRKPHLVNGEEANIGINGTIGFDELRNPGFSLSNKETAIRITVRRSDFGDFIYAVNLSDKQAQSTTLHINAKGARRFNAEIPAFEGLHYEKNPAGGIDIPLDLEPCGSIIVFLSGSAESIEKEEKGAEKRTVNPECVISDMDDNLLPLDYCALSYDGKTYGKKMPVMQVSDELLRGKTNRTVYLKYTFTVNAKPADLRLEAEDMGGAHLAVNGAEVIAEDTGKLDPLFKSYDIAKYVRYGENELIFRVDYYQSEHNYKVFGGVYYDHDDTTESMVNCLSYTTDIEAVYLAGKFCVEWDGHEGGEEDTLWSDGNFAVTLPRRYVTGSRIPQDGFPFFSGSMTLKTTIEAKGNEKYLTLHGHYSVASVRVNDGPAHRLLFTDTADVSGELTAGTNVLTVTLTSSMRNTLGFHHLPGHKDPHSSSPDAMSLYGHWLDENIAERYSDDYTFVKFGVDGIGLR